MACKKTLVSKIAERLEEIEDEVRQVLNEDEINSVVCSVNDRLNTDEGIRMNNIDDDYESKIEKPTVFSREFMERMNK